MRYGVCALAAAGMLLCAAAMGADGFGQYTTGGAGGAVVTVSNAADLELYAEASTNPLIIQVSGIIDLRNIDLEIRSNKTVRGIDSNATIIGRVGFQNRDSNIIIERLNITNPDGTGERDGISLKEVISNVFITRCTIYDCGDGCLDISNQSDLVTVSWCKFYYTFDSGHNFVNLIGSSDSQTADRGKLRVTMHHNWWTTLCKERMPRVRFGQVHVYNNYYGPGLLAGGYCIGVGVESHIRAESNYFNSVNMPWKNYYTGNGAAGEIGWNDGNVFSNCSIPTWAANAYGTIFTPPYSWTPDDAALVPAIVEWGAGAAGQDGYPPHWTFGPYGDFDVNGLIDMSDFAAFASYWLATSDIANADYDDDGIVNFVELAMFAGNWLSE